MSKTKLNLRFDFGAIEALEEQGINLMAGLDEAEFRKPSVVSRLIWAGQLHERPELTLEETRAALARLAPRDVLESLTAAIIRDLGSTDADANTDTAPAVPGMALARD